MSLRIVLVITLVVFACIPAAEARENTDIGITLSKSCITLIKNNITSDCPTYEQIMVLFPDTSKQQISGAFVYDDSGFYHRQSTRYLNHFNFYTYEPHTLWIDPPGDIVGRIPTITIEPSLTQYKVAESYDLVNRTQILGHSRWVDSVCHDATISAGQWTLLLGDTVRYLDGNCDPKLTNFEHLKEVYLGYTEQDITTSYKYKLDRWIAESKEKCKGLCFEY